MWGCARHRFGSALYIRFCHRSATTGTLRYPSVSIELVGRAKAWTKGGELMRVCISGYGTWLLLCGCLSGQVTTAPTVFEAASMKRSASSTMTALRGGPGTSGPGQLNYSGVPLRTLLLRIWKLTESQLSGPASIATERYDIVAKVPPGSTRDQLNQMIESCSWNG
jgi:hypothetical protein